ncbi:MAG TPA: tetratricopeptide repeat protein [Polyangia bacterium]|nr:tetratricopeptide repeat protein [Polyangia bacterium]
MGGGIAVQAGQAQAQAQGTAAAREEARKHFSKGKQLYNVQLYEDAVKEFREAYLKYPSPVFLFNIGQALRLAGQREQAVAAYERYLAESPRAPDRAEVETIIKQLKEEIAQLPIMAVPPWGPARLDQQGKPQQGTQPGPSPGPGAGPGTVQPPPPATVATPPPTPPTKPPRQPLSPRVRLGIGLTAGGVAVAAVGAGMFGWLRPTVSAYDRAYDRCFVGPNPRLPCDDRALGTLGRIQALNVAAPVLVGVGGALVPAGAVLWGVYRKEKPKVTVVPALLPGGAGIGFAGVLP